MKTKRKLLTAVIAFVAISALLFGIFYIWAIPTAYKPTEEAIEAFASEDNILVEQKEFGTFFDGPGKSAAIIFYPGARVDHRCYAPLMRRLALNGIDCFCINMPFNMAFFGINKADGILSEYNYEKWYISGHSLGGAMAASYAAKHMTDLDGLILLAAYPTATLKSENFTVVSIYGSEDKVLNMDKFNSGREFMPENYFEICIKGGNHASFGSYGEQKGDGDAYISNEEQQKQTVEAVLNATK